MPHADPIAHGERVIRAVLVGRRGAHLGPFADGDDAEAVLAAQATRNHIDIARLEHAQGEPPFGKQHGLQRKQR